MCMIAGMQSLQRKSALKTSEVSEIYQHGALPDDARPTMFRVILAMARPAPSIRSGAESGEFRSAGLW